MVDYSNPAALGAAARGDFVNAEIASTPGGIERQEAAGQKALVASTHMPIELHPSREEFEKVGFTFGDKIDEVFQSATLPAGWTREATGHAMHSDILDGKGRRRIAVFYKAAFYDRRADAVLIPRFAFERQYEGDAIDPVAIVIRDVGQTIKTFPIQADQSGDVATRYAKRRTIVAEAELWLNGEKPGWTDPTAYWDE